MFKDEIFYHPVSLFLGGMGIPFVYGAANPLMQIWQSDLNTNFSWDVYPGSWKCKHEQGHSIWHEVTGKGLLDWIFIGNYMHCVLEKRNDFMGLAGLFC